SIESDPTRTMSTSARSRYWASASAYACVAVSASAPNSRCTRSVSVSWSNTSRKCLMALMCLLSGFVACFQCGLHRPNLFSQCIGELLGEGLAALLCLVEFRQSGQHLLDRAVAILLVIDPQLSADVLHELRPVVHPGGPQLHFHRKAVAPNDDV